jgi:hypothetical protein
MAWACGQLGYRGTLLPVSLLQQAVKLLNLQGGASNMQVLCNLCWSAAVLVLWQLAPQVPRLASWVHVQAVSSWLCCHQHSLLGVEPTARS